MQGLPQLAQRKNAVGVTLAAFFFSLATISGYLALKNGGQVSVVGPLVQLSTIITVILAVFVLGEKRDIWQKMIAVVLSVIGAFLLF
jgi:uncharacterized membrane protein